MAGSKEAIPALVWCEASQRPLAAAVAKGAGLRVVSAGIAGDAARARGLDGSSAFPDAEPITDLRQALATAPIGAAFLAAPAWSAEAPLGDADLLRLARSRGITILTMEPIPATYADARAGDPSQWAETIRFIGLFRALPSLVTVQDLLATFGAARTVCISFRSGKGQGSLGARLFDAMHTVHSVLGMPEYVDAAVITQVAASGLRLEPGETLRSLHGDLTASLRFAGAKSAALSLSDRAGRWFRGVAIVGEDGCIRLDESGIERIDSDGAILEKSPAAKRKPKDKSGPLFEGVVDASAVEVLVEAARRAADPRAPRSEPYDLEAVVAMCEAAILSARTGQPESPATVMRMAGER